MVAVQEFTSVASGAMDNNSNDENDNDETSTAATTSSMPYILAGDWNIKPGDASYNLLTTGMMDKGKSFFDRLID